MDHRYRLHMILALIALTISLSACSGGASLETSPPIASYPKTGPIAIAPNPERVIVVYQAYIEIMVSNVDRAAEVASHLVYEHGGYLASSQSWYADGIKNTTLVLAVPSANFENLRHAILSLGDLVSESFSGELVEASSPYNQLPYSHITLQLHPSKAFAFPQLNPPGWNPMRTLERAFTVFMTIFSVITDILIWITVVGGPFFLVFLIARVIIRRSRRESKSPEDHSLKENVDSA